MGHHQSKTSISPTHHHRSQYPAVEINDKPNDEQVVISETDPLFKRVYSKVEHSYPDFTKHETRRLAKRLCSPKKLRKHYLKTNFTMKEPPALRIVTSPTATASRRRSRSHKRVRDSSARDSVSSTSSIESISSFHSSPRNHNHHARWFSGGTDDMGSSIPNSPSSPMSSSRNSTRFLLQHHNDDLDTSVVLTDHIIKIKLVVSEVYNGTAMKNVRRVMSPIISNSSRVPDFGLFHSSILVGPWKLEWVNSSLCIPRRCTTEKALLSIDIATIEGTEKIIDFADKLAQFISHVNIHYTYAQQRSDNKLNCQDFIDLFFETFHITPDFGRAIERYLNRLRRKGTANMTFEYDEDFQQTFKLETRKQKFKTHEQIDTFLWNLEAIDPDLEYNWPDEYKLLKAFDRAMWIRMFAAEKHRKAIASKLNDKTNMTEEQISQVNQQLEKFDEREKHRAVHTPLRRAHSSVASNTSFDLDNVSLSFDLDENEEISCPCKHPTLTGSYTLHYEYFDQE